MNACFGMSGVISRILRFISDGSNVRNNYLLLRFCTLEETHDLRRRQILGSDMIMWCESLDRAAVGCAGIW